MSITNSITTALKRAGIAFKICELTSGTYGVMAMHDYSGPYPSKEALTAHNTAEKIARRRGLRSEERGHYTATLIYTSEEVIAE